MSVPSDFRATIQTRHRRVVAEDGFDPAEGDGDTRHANAGKVVIVRRDKQRPCLVAFENQYTREFSAKIERRYADLRGEDRDLAIEREMKMLGSTFDLAWDVNGRIVLSTRLCERIRVDPNAEGEGGNLVFFYGVGETFEIWHAGTFADAAEADGDEDLAEDVRDMIADKLR